MTKEQEFIQELRGLLKRYGVSIIDECVVGNVRYTFENQEPKDNPDRIDISIRNLQWLMQGDI